LASKRRGLFEGGGGDNHQDTKTRRAGELMIQNEKFKIVGLRASDMGM
jgi:hypothetical protein